MRYQTSALLSNYVLGAASLQELRAAVDDVDWDDPGLHEDERAMLLNVEARLVGFDEGFSEEEDIKTFLCRRC
jgi:hypothetical protein